MVRRRRCVRRSGRPRFSLSTTPPQRQTGREEGSEYEAREKQLREAFIRWCHRKLGRDPEEVEVYYYWNLNEEVPYIWARIDGEEKCFLVGEEEEFEEVECDEVGYVYPSDTFDYDNYELLNGEPIPAPIPSWVLEELNTYGNPFVILVYLKEVNPSLDTFVRIRGSFLDKTVWYFIPYDDLEDEEAEAVEEWLRQKRVSVWNILESYVWIPLGYRGYQDLKEQPEQWTRVVEGWVGIGCGDPVIGFLDKLSKLEVDELPDFSVVFVFPRSSNICVVYFDVFVPKGKERAFIDYLRKMLGDKFRTEPEFGTEGVHYRIGYTV